MQESSQEISASACCNSNEDLVNCLYCGKRTPGGRDETCLRCSECQASVHFACLTDHVKMTDCCLLGDVFYKFTCKSCSPTGSEQVAKEKVSWLTALILALYNLQELQHLSRHGYFHWKLHIADFIDRKWTYIFGGSIRRKRAWHGTVSGTLSHYSPAYFQTGTNVLRESGWWKLTHENLSPYNTIRRKYESSIACKRNAVRSNHEDETAEDDQSQNSFRSSTTQPAANTSDSLSPDFGSDILSFSDSESLDVDIDLPMDIEKDVGFPRLDSELSELVDQYVTSEDHSSSFFTAHSVVKCEHADEEFNSERDSDSSCDSDGAIESIPPPKSLFSRREDRPLPWQKNCVSLISESRSCVPMTEYEEHQLIQKLSKFLEKDQSSVPCQILRLYRKLIVRQEQRHRRLSHFSDTTSSICHFGSSTESYEKHKHIRTLDRYQVMNLPEENQLLKNNHQSFMLRLLGQVEPTCFVSPYTERLLKPFIRRDYFSQPLRLRLMADLLQKANEKNPSWTQPKRYPIDYSYVQPHHISAVNSLCELFFWPGIDLTESLLYPDFSCVALYRKLVIGFAFMVPDVSNNESYISFLFTHPEWRTAGIGTFMLYHLIQTCMGKDITLHVSVTNPAVMLYQKFGFKVEELVQDFYDKYFPTDSKDCKHALFLRLSR